MPRYVSDQLLRVHDAMARTRNRIAQVNAEIKVLRTCIRASTAATRSHTRQSQPNREQRVHDLVEATNNKVLEQDAAMQRVLPVTATLMQYLMPKREPLSG